MIIRNLQQSTTTEASNKKEQASCSLQLNQKNQATMVHTTQIKERTLQIKKWAQIKSKKYYFCKVQVLHTRQV